VSNRTPWDRLLRGRSISRSLADELRALEAMAREASIAAGIRYSRTLVAEQSGVSAEALGAWIDGRRAPQDGATLIRVITVLASLAGQPAPDESDWRALWVAARQSRDRIKKPASRQQKLCKVLTWAVITVVPILLGGFFAPISSNGRGIVWNLLFPYPSQTQKQILEQLQASVAWCCSYTTVEGNGGYYWPGSESGMEHWFAVPHSQTIPDLTPSGVGVIEILLQTSGTEPILVAPPKVVIKSRTQNVKHGVVGIIPLYGQGNSAPGEFLADVDAPTPATVTIGSSGTESYYVSSTSSETFILTLTDVKYNCVFDIQLTWMAQGRRQTRLLTNGGHHFRILGSAGLPWYTGSPGLGQPFIRASGHPFSFYATGNA
jgi:hypothetical protein